jgi:hypothetical protein
MAGKMSILLGGARSPPVQSDERNDVYPFPGGGEALVFVMRSRFAFGDNRRRCVMIDIDSKFMYLQLPETKRQPELLSKRGCTSDGK